MHPITGTVLAVLLLLPSLWILQVEEHGCECPITAASTATEPRVVTATTGPVADPGIFGAQPGSFAIQTAGSVLVSNGDLQVVNGDILLRGRSLLGVLNAMIEQGRAACAGIPCVHGVHDFLLTCHCICEDGWVGQACDTYTCNGNGAWNTALQRCDCAAPYEASTQCRYQMCRGVMALTCPPLLSSGCDVAGQLPADGCSQTCAAPQSCARRANWGRAYRPTAGFRAGICGGGFLMDTVQIAAMQCEDGVTASECADIFDEQAPYCCSPGARCGAVVCRDIACCAQRTDREACLSAGCAWASGRVCMDPSVANVTVDCEVAPTFGDHWTVFSYACTDATCPVSAQSRYQQIYLDACNATALFEPGNPCLDVAYAAVNLDAWPELLPSPVPLFSSFRLDLTGDAAIGLCSTANTLCRVSRAHAAQFSFVPAAASEPTEWQEAGASGYLLLRDGHRLVCIVSSTLPSFVTLQVFTGRGIPVSPIDDNMCGIFVLPANRSGLFKDEEGERDLSIEADSVAVWGTNGSIITLSIV